MTDQIDVTDAAPEEIARVVANPPKLRRLRSEHAEFLTPKTITFDQWAESGGTAGIFARGVRSGKIKIVDEE